MINEDNLRWFECAVRGAPALPELQEYTRAMLCWFARSAPLKVIVKMAECVIALRELMPFSVERYLFRILVRTIKRKIAHDSRTCDDRARPVPTGKVYFVQDEKLKIGRGWLKIGWTGGSVEKRLRELQIGSPYVLEIVASFPGTQGDEHKLHDTFHKQREHGEWFRPNDTICDLLEGLRSEAFIKMAEWAENYRSHNTAIPEKSTPEKSTPEKCITGAARAGTGRRISGDEWCDKCDGWEYVIEEDKL